MRNIRRKIKIKLSKFLRDDIMYNVGKCVDVGKSMEIYDDKMVINTLGGYDSLSKNIWQIVDRNLWRDVVSRIENGMQWEEKIKKYYNQ